MKVSPKELAIIASAELRAEAPIEVIRKGAGYREHTVRYALRSLQERKILNPCTFINLHKLGYTVYTLFFSAAVERRSTSHKDSLLRTLLNAPYILWVGEFGGEYQYGIGVCCKSFQELIMYMRDISKKHENVFFDKAISLQISSTIFPRRYIWQKKLDIEPITSSCIGEETVEIDHLDERILSGLSSYSGLSHRQLALKLNTPLSTLELRIKKLKESGVIIENIFTFDSRVLGREGFKILVYTKGLDLDFTKDLMKFCLKHPEVTYLIDCLGIWGYEIGVEVTSGDQVTAIIQELYETFPGLINTAKPLTKFRYSKFRFFPEVP